MLTTLPGFSDQVKVLAHPNLILVSMSGSIGRIGLLLIEGSCRKRSCLDIAAGERQEGRPIRYDCVAAAVLTPGQIAVYQCGIYCGKFCRSQILFSKQAEHRSGCDCGHETAALVHPLTFRALPLSRAVADEGRPWGAEGDQLVRVHRQVTGRQRPAVLDEVARHPMIPPRAGEVFNEFTESSPVQLRPAFAR